MERSQRALISSRYAWRHAASLLLVLATVVAFAAPACSSNGAASTTTSTLGCSLNSDCANGLVCALGRCRNQCSTPADCAGQPCITDGLGRWVCEQPKETNTPCSKEADCPAPLACATDYHCRNLCAVPTDCNAPNVTGRICASDANGVHYCADPGDTDGGVLTDKAPPGAPDVAVIEPPDATLGGNSSSSSGSSSGGSSGSTSSSGGASIEGGPEGGSSGSSSGSSDSGGSSESSDSGSSSGGPTCSPPCGPGKACVSGACVSCGTTQGGPCCPSATDGGTGQCGSNLTCSAASKCDCGNPGQPCCAGTMCNAGVTCVMPVGGAPSCACGAAGQACCPADAGPTQCTSPLECAGINCSCLIACSGDMVEVSDGSLWTSSTTPVLNPMGKPFLVATAPGSFAYAAGLGCAVTTDGSVWCWGSNTYGELGNGTTTASTMLPVQVLTNAAGPALSGIKKVFVETSYGYTACAVNASGSVWCWGYGNSGQLGTGYTNNSLVAVPVVTSSGGPQLTGVDQVSIGYYHACAHKTDGTAWCWGDNTYGEIGVGTTQMQYLYPQQVASLFTSVVNVSVGSQVSCATTTDGGVWCWGSNSEGTLGNGLHSGQAVTPGAVLVSAEGGATFTGAQQVEIMYAGYSACALKAADHSIWCWGYYSPGNSYVPVPYTENSFPISGVYAFCGNQPNNYASFLDAKGVFHDNGSGTATQVTCP